jgi:hypothetical protein
MPVNDERTIVAQTDLKYKVSRGTICVKLCVQPANKETTSNSYGCKRLRIDLQYP